MDDRHLFRFAPGGYPFLTKLNLPTCTRLVACRARLKCAKQWQLPQIDQRGDVSILSGYTDEIDLNAWRANSLRLMLSGQLGSDALTSPDMAETMTLRVLRCLQTRMPNRRDMARMKIELTALQAEKNGLSWHDKLIAHIPDYAPYAAWLAPVLRPVT